MEERDSEKQFQIRALTGESITLSISTNKTIADLKLLLAQIFPLAAKYSNFNLFHKGVRLSMQGSIGDYLIEPGEVIGFVPVIKKKTVQTPKSYDSENSADIPNQSPITKFADLAWSDMMQDIHDMSSTSKGLDMGSGSLSVSDDGNNVNEKNSATPFKRKRSIDGENAGPVDDNIMSILQASGTSFFNDQNLKKVEKVMELQNCLQDLSSNRCVLLNIDSTKAGGSLCGKSAGLCMCPQWLKTIVKSFTFLNIYAAYLQLQQKKITSNHVKEALSWLGRFNIQVSIKDIENLSLLCPKALCFVDHSIKGKRIGHALVIISTSEENNQPETGARIAANELSLPRLIYLVKRRERSFMVALASVVHKIGNMVNGVSTIEDLLKCVKEGDNSPNEIKKDASAAGGNEGRWVRAASASNAGKRLCHDISALLPTEMVKHLREGIGSNGQIVHVEEIGCRKPAYKPIPDELSQDIKHMLERIGVTKLYSHQADSIQASLAHKHVVVATTTSSGKSLCYNLPVLEELLKDPSSCALYMFPTKALSQDQLRALNCMTEGFSSHLCVGIYDGDTPQNERTYLRENARVLITNPDMLHKSILPYHGKFVRILSKLRFVVIDEAHSYKGAFGCHTALILRRLRRLCSHVYGSNPAFIFCTATSANPREHCMNLANLSNVELIQNDGSPSAEKLFVLWNPLSSLSAAADGKQRGLEAWKSSNKGSSSIWEVSCLFAEIIQHGLRCITFCGSRKLCELVLCYAQEILQETAPHLVGSISSYRSGYAPEVRRQIENDFFAGKLRGLAATNALELGIDVGHLDATLHLGFPGSIASLWQQAGRSGRREKSSIAVYVAFNGPLDQYFMKYPQKLFRSPVECWNIDAQNHQVLEQHLVCAALEHPLSAHYDENFFGSSLSNIIMTLRNRGYLSSNSSHESSARIWSYIGREKKPADIVNIRAIEMETYQVIDIKTNEVLEKIEESKAFFQVYDGAVYLRQGKTYLVKNLDLSCKIAWCQEADLKYYTKTRDLTDIKVVGGDIAYPVSASHISQTNAEASRIPRTTARANPCKVITTWFGFRRISRGSNQVLDTVELSLPKYSYESQAVWIQVPQAVKEAVETRNISFRAGLHAASHALLNVVPLCIICNSLDLAPECSNPHDSRSFAARILLYDKHPGGTGVALQVRPHFSELLNAALEILSSCCCLGDAGCPKCIQTPACHEYNEDLHKDAAVIIIKGVLDSEKSHFASL